MLQKHLWPGRRAWRKQVMSMRTLFASKPTSNSADSVSNLDKSSSRNCNPHWWRSSSGSIMSLPPTEYNPTSKQSSTAKVRWPSSTRKAKPSASYTMSHLPLGPGNSTTSPVTKCPIRHLPSEFERWKTMWPKCGRNWASTAVAHLVRPRGWSR